MHRQTDRQMDRQKQTDHNNPLLSSSVKKNEESFWGVTNPSKLLHVIDEMSVGGNNTMGNILMEYAKRTK